VLNKQISDQEIFETVEKALKAGWRTLKLYFMVGLPGEMTDDVAAIVVLVRNIKERFRGEISVNVSPFVPKAHTPLQWAAMATPEILEKHLSVLKEGLEQAGVELKAESIAWSSVQGVLARGDRRLAQVLIAMDGHTSLRAWEKALRDQDLSEEEYLRQRSAHEALPWQVVDMGVSLDYLRVEAERAGLGLSSPSCTGIGCDRCGVCEPAKSEEH